MTKLCSIDWQAVREELNFEEWQYDASDMTWRRSVGLGSWMSLCPSGKYYMPWAYSNVEPCKHCSGTGKLSARRPKRKRLERVLRRRRRLTLSLTARYGSYHNWPDLSKLNRLIEMELRYAVSQECLSCGGLGSREAYLDEMFREEMEAGAEEVGLFVSESEGDPTYLIVEELSHDRPKGVNTTACSVCGGRGRLENFSKCAQCSGKGVVELVPTENLDGIHEDELGSYLDQMTAVRQAVLEEDDPDLLAACDMLMKYAALRHQSVALRRSGLIHDAIMVERNMQTVYEKMPSWCQW